ncbi:MAG: 4Fe-4S dicluster domain-containing protein [Deltaproteobacteria bacterium]|nr:4Fe-4S dicluster domain-containing protein [Deltaproteobacteria bacterium]
MDNKKYAFITEKDFKGLVTGLIKEYKVFGTIKKDGFPAFAGITSFDELELFQSPTHLSAKEFLFPQRETLLKFNIQNKTHEPVIESGEQVIIGMHSCDIHALTLMDRVFAAGTPDPNYLSRRAKTIIIGTECFPDKFCFCKSVGTMTVEEGFDIFLHKLKKGFLVRTGSVKGEEILSRLTKSRPAAFKEIKEVEALQKVKEGSFITTLDAPAEELPGIYEKSDNSPVWDRIGAICYGCGSCNHVCPTCYCFDIKDEVKANLKEGERVRVWDGCMVEDFAKVAGDHNFRGLRANRLKHRFNRKFRYLTGKFDALFCVGCGRCSRTCLVNINIAEITNELIREHNKK